MIGHFEFLTMISFFGLLFLLFISRLSSGTKITLSGDLNVFNFQRVLLAARKTDTIALWLYAYFLRIDLPILTDAKTCSHYLDKIQRRLILTLDSVYQRHHHRLEFWIFFFFFTTAIFTEICRYSSWKMFTFI